MGSSTSSTVGKRKKEDDDHSDGSPLKKNKRHDEGLSKKMQLTYVVFHLARRFKREKKRTFRRCVEDVSTFRNIFEDVVRFVMKDRNISVEDVFTETSVDHWKFNDSHLIFRFYGEEKEEGGAVYDLYKNSVTVEILDGCEFLPLDDDDEDIAVELQSEIEQSEW